MKLIVPSYPQPPIQQSLVVGYTWGALGKACKSIVLFSDQSVFSTFADVVCSSYEKSEIPDWVMLNFVSPFYMYHSS